jgi:hypothetical protein
MLDGDWQILAIDYGHEALPGEGGLLQIIGSRFSLQLGGAPRTVGGVEYRAASDTAEGATAAPATLDLSWSDTLGAPARRIRAIVRVRGDLMQFCYYPEEGPARPGAFEARASAAHPPAILVRCRRRL